ncbi:carbon-nitrogen hydrolase [Lentinula edodes]|uniref:carbon-nitrogen hydrolase n=1 Tax=Lentinula edodes TaxID=5353 RepID=UPI001E8CEF0B|nr:carbon-nitrogen hydrolase [Lentinula edodes]KAH7879670.1 carbon-nitrogen hydrolase [Lentinula edodes]
MYQSQEAQELRIALVQFSPKVGQVEANARRAKELCSTIEPGTIDLLCFPEMILSGYVFEDSNEISPFLELPQVGPTSQMCASLARGLGCYVLAGYPEQLSDREISSQSAENTGISDVTDAISTPGSSIVGANSAVLCGPNGYFIGNYRKTNLFATDRTWAKAGSGFASFVLPPPIGRLTLGICMDLNAQPPADWKTRGPPYEVAEYALKEDVDVVVMLNAWLDSRVKHYESKLSDDGEVMKKMKADWGKEEENEKDFGDIFDWTTVEFWATRLKPLWVQGGASSSLRQHDTIQARLSGSNSSAKEQKESKDEEEVQGGVCASDRRTIVVICNRTGEEKGQTFAGSSAIFNMCHSSGMPRIVGIMGRREEGVRSFGVPLTLRGYKTGPIRVQ